MTKDTKTRAATIFVIVASLAVLIGQKYDWKVSGFDAFDRPSVQENKEAEPRDVIYRMLDAARDGDVDAYIACYSGQMERMLTQSRSEMTPEGFSQYLTERNRAIKGIAVSEPETLSVSQVRVRVEYVYADRNEAQRFYVEKLAGGWKISRTDAAVRVETSVRCGTPVY
jgi:ketosteroid isomerase-like protein